MAEWQVEAYDRLRTEIVRSAVYDYRKALRKTDRLGYVCEEQISLERWFLSKWGQMMCENTGKEMMDRCRNTYKSTVSKKGKRHISDDVQKKICKDYKDGVRFKTILQKYKIPSTTLYYILRRWDS
jgi:hypothetical protein